MKTGDAPVYNLKAALRETGLKADALRAWERRYGLPRPRRTAGGQRLYSHRDIETIRWLVARQHEGLSISHAVDLWREIEGQSRDPLHEPGPAELVSRVDVTSAESSLSSLREKWLETCMLFDETAAEEVLSQALSYHPVERVVLDVLQQGVRRLGEMWYTGEITVQQEHFASALAARRIEALIAATPAPIRRETVLMACPPDEWHTFSLLLLNLLIRRRGFNVVYLGPNVPNDHLYEAVESIRPGLVVLACQHLASAAQLRVTASLLAEKGVQVAYGGLVFNTLPALQERISAHFLGESLEASLQAIEGLIATPRPAPPVEEITAQVRRTVAAFREKRGLIEAALIDDMKGQAIPTEYVETANRFFGDEIAAALELGGMAHLEPDMKWLGALLVHQSVPSALLVPYLVAYRRAAQSAAGDDLTLITDWIDAYVQDEMNHRSAL